MVSNKIVTAIDGVTETTISDAINIEGAKKVTFLFSTTGSAIFTVEGSLDGTTFKDSALMIPSSSNTNAQTVMREVSRTLNAGSKICALDLQNFCYHSIRITATESANGTHGCTCLVEY
jgi:hypothetical protein